MNWLSLDPVYFAISWILLRWHELWDFVLPNTSVLGTNFDWILAIVFLVLTVRVLLFPLFVKQIKSQRAMQAVQPKVKELQEKHKGDRETLQRELMELYRRENANPLMGCLPLVLQLPVFLGLFHVLRRLDPSTHKAEATKTLYGWTVQQFDSAASAQLFGAPLSSMFRSSSAQLAALHANGTTVKIVAAILIAIMIITTYLTSRQMILKTGWAEDPNQRMIQRVMLYGIPFSLLISGALFPIGVVIYWVTTNLFSLGQQHWVLHKYPPPTAAAAAAAVAGKNGSAGKGSPAKAAKASGKDGEPAKIDGKALAPRPGVKPANPKKSNRKRKARR